MMVFGGGAFGRCLGPEDGALLNGISALMEKAMAPHSSTLAWKIPWTKEPSRRQSLGLHRVGHD